MKDHWSQRPLTYLGSAEVNFPNLFMICGPLSAFSNVPPALEAHVDFITGIIALAQELSRDPAIETNGVNGVNGHTAGRSRIELEALPTAEAEFYQMCSELCTQTLY